MIIRDHSYYSQPLYDAIMAEWEPLTDKDILVISYGGWYPRFVWQSDQVRQAKVSRPSHNNVLAREATYLCGLSHIPYIVS